VVFHKPKAKAKRRSCLPSVKRVLTDVQALCLSDTAHVARYEQPGASVNLLPQVAEGRRQAKLFDPKHCTLRNACAAEVELKVVANEHAGEDATILTPFPGFITLNKPAEPLFVACVDG
jgi:hypothetical protein